MVDQLSAKWIEAPARRAIPTPNLDRLQAMGTTFSNAFTSNPICMAARPTIATGLTSRGHGVLTNGYTLSPELPTFMRALQRAEWRTGAFGKVHFHPHFAGVHPDYRPYGFDVVRNTEDPRAGEWLDWVGKHYPEHYDAVLATIWATGIPELETYGPESVDLRARIEGLRSEGFAGGSAYALPYPEEMSQTAWITNNALQFVDDTDPARPILAHISYVQPHSPFCPPGEYMQYVDIGAIPEPAGIEWIEDPAAPACFRGSEGARSAIPDEWRSIRQHYFADIVHLDSKLGMVLDALERSGRLETTFILLLSDHGELLLDHGFTGKGERHYDASIRIPFVIAGPGIVPGASRTELVQLEDVYPTVLEIAGLSPPEIPTMGPYLHERPAATYGHSLLPLARGEELTSRRDSVYVESYNNIDSATPVNWARTVRTSRFRYTYYPGGSGEQLFDLDDDPCEQRNLIHDPTHAEVRLNMRDLLLEHVILQDYPPTPRHLFALGVH